MQKFISPKIYALHGFLGLPSDWDSVGQNVDGSFESIEPFPLSHPRNGLQNWGQAFNAWVAKQPEQRRVLLGYSLGGRLAMHALIDAPELWSGAIIVSSNTGIKFPDERAPRLEVDIQWARRFLNDPWEELMNDWNRQDVFQGQKPTFLREEESFIRSELADAIEGWSVAKQNDLQESLAKLPLPILWVAGEKDLKYVGLAKQMAAMNPYSSCWIAPEVGHRVPWESSSLFLKEINSWIKRL